MTDYTHYTTHWKQDRMNSDITEKIIGITQNNVLV